MYLIESYLDTLKSPVGYFTNTLKVKKATKAIHTKITKFI